MRDIIWTIIIIWLVYKIVGIFQNLNAKRTTANAAYETPKENHHHSPSEIKNALKNHANKEGEYVDYEDIK
ncbi:MAG: hypothetical protein JNL60_17470 [Bacteroidia bacterium]|nr:hypothetical protein [Bacteroidia bacterium]